MEDAAERENCDDQVGLGVDIVEIARMKAILARTPSFARRVFSEEERAYCDGKATPEIHYATRFAAKEAVLKALGTGFSGGIRPRDVEVRRSSKGRPYAVLHGAAKEVAHARGVRELPISLSYTHTEAVACAMAITEGSVRATQERVDPMADLAQRFKEARGMLDEIGNAPQRAPDGTNDHEEADVREGEGSRSTVGRDGLFESGLSANEAPEREATALGGSSAESSVALADVPVGAPSDAPADVLLDALCSGSTR